MPDEKESFSLVDAASDLFGGLAAGVTVAAVYHDISGILAGPVGVGVAPIGIGQRFNPNEPGPIES